MGRNSERGQMMIELLILVFAFVGFFFFAIGLTKSGEHAEQRYQFSSPPDEFSHVTKKRGFQ